MPNNTLLYGATGAGGGGGGILSTSNSTMPMPLAHPQIAVMAGQAGGAYGGGGYGHGGHGEDTHYAPYKTTAQARADGTTLGGWGPPAPLAPTADELIRAQGGRMSPYSHSNIGGLHDFYAQQAMPSQVGQLQNIAHDEQIAAGVENAFPGSNENKGDDWKRAYSGVSTFAYGGGGVHTAIVGDPQADGGPNPELVTSDSPIRVTPLRGNRMPKVPMLADGTDDNGVPMPPPVQPNQGMALFNPPATANFGSPPEAAPTESVIPQNQVDTNIGPGVQPYQFPPAPAAIIQQKQGVGKPLPGSDMPAGYKPFEFGTAPVQQFWAQQNLAQKFGTKAGAVQAYAIEQQRQDQVRQAQYDADKFNAIRREAAHGHDVTRQNALDRLDFDEQKRRAEAEAKGRIATGELTSARELANHHIGEGIVPESAAPAIQHMLDAGDSKAANNLIKFYQKQHEDKAKNSISANFNELGGGYGTVGKGTTLVQKKTETTPALIPNMPIVGMAGTYPQLAANKTTTFHTLASQEQQARAEEAARLKRDTAESKTGVATPSELLRIHEHGANFVKQFGPQMGGQTPINAELYKLGLEMMSNPTAHFNKIINPDGSKSTKTESPKSKTQQMKDAAASLGQ